MKYLNTSNSTFADFITGNCVYVDKTAFVHELISPHRAQYFLSRPRRFGKSLLISTLKSIFQGRRELFEGLAIDRLTYDWKPYPVIHLNMGSATGATVQEFNEFLMARLQRIATEHGLTLKDANVVNTFQMMIEMLFDKMGPVVVLIDEYDKPLLGHLGHSGVRDIQRSLKNFYGVIKTCEDKLRFALITGVSKFSKVSIFSDLNNLNDLTMQRKSATLFGYTQEELEDNFAEYIDHFSREKGLAREDLLAQLKLWYNGYRFHQDAPTVYNPVSVMKCLAEKEFTNFWFETGTPTFLIDLLRKKPLIPTNLSVLASAFSAYDPEKLEVLPLLVQTGYLTIKSSQLTGRQTYFELGYPNAEVEDSFNEVLAKGLAQITGLELNQSILAMVSALNMGDIDAMLEHLKVFFAGIPYDIQLSHEKYYQSLFFVIFRLLGTIIEAECRTASGRIDALIKTPERWVLFEFKLHDSAEAALAQIHSKDYALAYVDDGREIIRVGVAFDAKTRNLDQWLIEDSRS